MPNRERGNDQGWVVAGRRHDGHDQNIGRAKHQIQTRRHHQRQFTDIVGGVRRQYLRL